jgi:hypothetical protein
MSKNESDKLVEKLGIIRGNIILLSGMVSKIEQYKVAAETAKNDIDAVLFELTGNEFYKNKEG